LELIPQISEYRLAKRGIKCKKTRGRKRKIGL